MTATERAAAELLAAIDAIYEHGKQGGHSAEYAAMVDRYAIAKAALRAALVMAS